MELLIVLAALWVLISPVLFLVFLVGGSGQRQRIETLERDLFSLRLMHEDLARRVGTRERTAARTPLAAATATALAPPWPSIVSEPVAVPVRSVSAIAAHERQESNGGEREGGEAAESVAPPMRAQAPGVVPVAEPRAPETAKPGEPVEAPEDRPSPPKQGDWERWIGVRGAAALGAGMLVLAGLYFFKYSIDKGFLTPTLRVVLGALAGVGCLIASERRLRRTHALLANWIAGAGVAILYTSFWAARSVYGIVGVEVGFGAMVVVTAACTLLALRHGSLAIALLGLAGGFATPLALSTGSDRPLALFGYLLVLDVALLVIADRKRWPALGVLSLAATALYEALWIGARMGSDRLWLGIAILLAFTGVFALGVRAERREGVARTSLTQVASLVLPFLFAFTFAFRADLAVGLVPLAVMLGALSVAAGWIGRARNAPWLVAVAAASSVAIFGVWMTSGGASSTPAWQIATVTFFLAAVPHGFLELEHARPRGAARALSFAAGVGSLAGAVILTGAATMGSEASPWPWLAGLAALSALVVRHAGFARREPLHVAAGVVLGLGLFAMHLAHGQETAFGEPAAFLAALVAAPTMLHLVGWLPRSASARRWAHHGAALLATMLLFDPIAMPTAYGSAAFAWATVSLGAVALVSGAATGEGLWMLATSAALALVHAGWSADLARVSADPRAALALAGLTVVALTAWPFLATRRSEALRHEAWAWRAATLAGAAFYPALRGSWAASQGGDWPGAVPLALAGLSIGAASLTGRAEDERASRARAWFGTTGVAFVTLAIGVSFQNEWLTIGWALEGLALIALWRRAPHPGLKYAGLAHLGAVVVRLVANPAVLDYHPHAAVPVFNWIAWTYGLPSMAIAGAWLLLAPVEVERTLAWEPGAQGADGKPFAFGAIACAAATAIVGFVWLNLMILDGFAAGDRLEIVLSHLPARDLTMSIAWVAYAVGLLAMGMGRASAALRWASLALVLATVGKVFLYDLGHLRDLYRVASLVGLALSLIVISIAYQRFVFGPGAQRRNGAMQ